MKRIAALLASLVAVSAAAQVPDIQFGSSPNPVGSGARALGIGSSFIATAADASAASWNPAGLIALEQPEASLVFSYKRRVASLVSLGGNCRVVVAGRP